MCVLQARIKLLAHRSAASLSARTALLGIALGAAALGALALVRCLSSTYLDCTALRGM